MLRFQVFLGTPAAGTQMGVHWECFLWLPQPLTLGRVGSAPTRMSHGQESTLSALSSFRKAVFHWFSALFPSLFLNLLSYILAGESLVLYYKQGGKKRERETFWDTSTQMGKLLVSSRQEEWSISDLMLAPILQVSKNHHRRDYPLNPGWDLDSSLTTNTPALGSKEKQP